jgi:hypothetical protein
MDMQNILCKLAGKKDAFAAMEEKTSFWNFKQKGYIEGVLDDLEEVIKELEISTGLRAPVKRQDDKVVQIQHRQVVR